MAITKKVTTIQKGNVRYTFKAYDNGKCFIETEQNLTTGASLFWRTVSAEHGNEFYKRAMAEGFRRFRNINEVSWYATKDNNTPYEEEWVTDGIYLVPVKSRVLEEG